MNKSQDGFVSIVVSLIIMIVLSLITIGFVQIMSREQRQALDRQLSTQAFYAAESGVNDASVLIRQNVQYQKSDCAQLPGAPATIDPVGPVVSTCVTVEPNPFEIKFEPVTVNQNLPTVFPLVGLNNSNSEVPIDELIITWSGAAGSTGPLTETSGTLETLPANADWVSRLGMLKMTIVPFDTNDDRLDIIQKTGVLYLKPFSDTDNISYTDLTTDRTAIIGGTCSGDSCTARITNLPTVGPNLSVQIVLTSIYRNSNVSIRSRNSGAATRFRDVQSAIDSTGRANDVLRRIQVRRPARDTYEITPGALQAGAICKQFTASPTRTVSYCGP